MTAGSSPGSTRNWLVPGLLVLVSALFVAVPAGATAEEAASFDFTYPRQRLDAPIFEVQDLHGNAVSLEAYRGKVVLVHFWATFCIPCLEEMPALESLWQKYGGDGLVVLGIAADRGNTEIVREFAEKTGASFPIVHDSDGRVRNQYEVAALPTSYLVGRDGRISGRAVGTRSWDEPGGRKVVETLLDIKGAQ
jgi:peroxiredoxin